MALMPAILVHLVAAALGLGAFMFLSRKTRRTLSETAVSISSLADGDLSRARSIDAGNIGKDEKRLAEALSALAMKLSSETHERRAIGQGLYSVGNELDQEMAKAATVVKGIAAAATMVSDQVTDHSAGIEETAVTIGRILENLGRQNASIESQAAAVGQTAAAVEQMITNAEAIARNTARMDESFDELQSALRDGNEKLAAMIQRTSEISRQSDSLQEANQVIASIASQTNLLAMNAAIEAAHAGDSGRGFSVVSQEIRKLAESAAEQSKQIAKTIQTIRSGISELDGDSAVTDRAFATVRERISGISSLETQIKGAMDEQGEGSRSIMEATGSLRKITDDVRHGSEEMATGSRAIESEMTRLIEGNARVGETVREIMRNTGNMEITVETVKEMSRRNKGLSDTLYANILTYKTAERILRLGHSQSKTHSRHISAEALARWAEEKSGGSLRLELFPAEMLGSEMKMTEDAAKGALDMVVSPTQVEYEPLMGLLELPFLFSSLQQVGSVLESPIVGEMARSLPGKGLRALAFWESGFVQITNNVRPIRVPQDLSGLKIRTGENEMTVLTLSALGAVPVRLPFTKVHSALASGEIDGQENPIANIESARLYEVQRYISVLNYKNAFATVMISERVWATLSAEHQAILREGARRLMKDHLRMIEENQAAALARLEKSGMEVARPSLEPFRVAVSSVYDRAASRFGKDWVERVIKAVPLSTSFTLTK
jgi:tripartite ATP-independent transporter DctP family solute receptor